MFDVYRIYAKCLLPSIYTSSIVATPDRVGRYKDEELNSLNWIKLDLKNAENITTSKKESTSTQQKNRVSRKIRDPETRTWNQVQAQESSLTGQATGPTGRPTGRQRS